jgi:hypothetical protein
MYNVHTPYTEYILYSVCMSPRQNLDSPTPSLVSECAPPPGTKGGGQTRLRVRGWGSPNSDDRRKSLALCQLCDLHLLCTLMLATFPIRTPTSTPTATPTFTPPQYIISISPTENCTLFFI